MFRLATEQHEGHVQLFEFQGDVKTGTWVLIPDVKVPFEDIQRSILCTCTLPDSNRLPKDDLECILDSMYFALSQYVVVVDAGDAVIARVAETFPEPVVKIGDGNRPVSFDDILVFNAPATLESLTESLRQEVAAKMARKTDRLVPRIRTRSAPRVQTVDSTEAAPVPAHLPDAPVAPTRQVVVGRAQGERGQSPSPRFQPREVTVSFEKGGRIYNWWGDLIARDKVRWRHDQTESSWPLPAEYKILQESSKLSEERDDVGLDSVEDEPDLFLVSSWGYFMDEGDVCGLITWIKSELSDESERRFWWTKRLRDTVTAIRNWAKVAIKSKDWESGTQLRAGQDHMDNLVFAWAEQQGMDEQAIRDHIRKKRHPTNLTRNAIMEGRKSGRGRGTPEAGRGGGGSRGRRRGRGDRKTKGTCWTCGEEGHLQNACPKGANQDPGNGNRGGRRGK